MPCEVRKTEKKIKVDADEVDPEVADGLRRSPSEAPDQGRGHGDARRRGDEILKDEPDHLGEIRERRLAGVVLPVRVAGEARSRVEGQIGPDRTEVLRIEGQEMLEPEYRVREQKTGQAEEEKRARVLLPVLFAAGP